MSHRAERRAKLPDGVPVGLFRTTPQGTILDVNESLVEMLGYPHRQALLALRSDAFYFDPGDHAHVQALVAQRRVLRNHETRVRRHDGRPLWVELSLRALADTHGRVVYEGAVVDVTDRKLAEEALWASERRLRLFVEQVPAVLWSVDRELVFTLSLGTGLAALGLRANEVVGSKLAQYLHTDDPRHPVLDAHRRGLHGESMSYEIDVAGREFQAYIEPWREADGTISGVIGVALDVTEHLRLAQALREGVTLRDAALDTLDDGVLMVDPDGNVVACNAAFTRLWGVTETPPAGSSGQALADLLAPRLREPQAWLARLAGAGLDDEASDELLLAGGHRLHCRTRALRAAGHGVGRLFTFRAHEPTPGAA